MNINSSEQNIENAFSVAKTTYVNLSKLFSALDNVSIENGFVNIIKDQKSFLRWKSDNDPFGWLINSFIKLYQGSDIPKKIEESQSDEIRNNEFIYAIDFNLEESPILKIAKFSFDIAEWTNSPNVSDHWVYYWPLKTDNLTEFDFIEEGKYTKSTPKNKTIADKFRKLNYAKFKNISLINITSENFIENIFDEFKSM